jgi:hypothetical protein
MFDIYQYFSQLWPAIRQWPIYTALVALGLLAFTVMGLRGYRLLGDDNESTETEQAGAPRAGGHGGFVHGFNHK